MKEQAIEVLQKQLSKLDQKQIDFKAWKQQTSLLLERIFGENDSKSRKINELDYEFSSWSLRDASGNISYKEGVKKSATAILEAAIIELEHFGIPASQKSSEPELGNVSTFIKDELTGHQVKSIRTIITSTLSTEEKTRQLHELLDGLDKTQIQYMLIKILLKEEFYRYF
ncbi:MAG: hypothetical protein M0Q41_06800 [Bacteroidales bacterium]|nr:hypothetical protein [Bacteroidales bacterium]